MQYNITVIVRAIDMEDDTEDAYGEFLFEAPNVQDAVIDVAHHIDGTRPMAHQVIRWVAPGSPGKS